MSSLSHLLIKVLSWLTCQNTSRGICGICSIVASHALYNSCGYTGDSSCRAGRAQWDSEFDTNALRVCRWWWPHMTRRWCLSIPSSGCWRTVILRLFRRSWTWRSVQSTQRLIVGNRLNWRCPDDGVWLWTIAGPEAQRAEQHAGALQAAAAHSALRGRRGPLPVL